MRALKNLVRVSRPSLLFLSEIKVSKIRFEFLRVVLSFSHCFIVDRVRLGGGLAFL